MKAVVTLLILSVLLGVLFTVLAWVFGTFTSQVEGSPQCSKSIPDKFSKRAKTWAQLCMWMGILFGLSIVTCSAILSRKRPPTEDAMFAQPAALDSSATTTA